MLAIHYDNLVIFFASATIKNLLYSPNICCLSHAS